MPLAVELSGIDRCDCAQALAQVIAARRPGSDAGLVAGTEAMLAASLADRLLRHEAVRHADDVDLRCLAAIESWIDGHLAGPITMGRLCAVAGVGARALKKGFELRRGVSPLRLVTEHRLRAAFRRLSRPEPDETLTAVWLSLGFTHPARLSGHYRTAFGEWPSRTLDRGRR